MKGQMILASSLIVLIFVSLIALQLPPTSPGEIAATNIFSEHERAARASFYYDAKDAVFHLEKFSEFAHDRDVFSVYATARHDGSKAEITFSNFLGGRIENITVYQSLSGEYDFAPSLDDKKSRVFSFSTASAGPYNATIEYSYGGKKNTLSLDSVAAQGSGLFKGVVFHNGVSKEVNAKNY